MSGFIVLLWLTSFVLAFVVGSKLNKSRRQSQFWWVWVLCLGWIGVIIIACQNPTKAAAVAVAEQKVVYVQVAPDGNVVPLNVEIVPAPADNTVF